MSYTLTSSTRTAYRGGVSGATPHAGYETATKLNRVIRYAFTAPPEGVSAVRFSIPGLARADQNSDYNGLCFAVTLSDSSHRSANAAEGAPGSPAPVNGNGTTYVLTGSCAVNIAPGAEFYLWIYPAHRRYSLWNFLNVPAVSLDCEAGAASFKSLNAETETLAALSAAVGAATEGMSHRLRLCDGETELLASAPFTSTVSLPVPRSVFAAYPDKAALSLTARLQAYTDPACTAPYGPPAAAPVTVRADPGMRPALPESALTESIVNPNSAPVGAVVGRSRYKLMINLGVLDFSASPGAGLGSVTVNGEELQAPNYEYISGILNDSSTKIDITLTDTRGRSDSLSRIVTAQDYAPPSITEAAAERCSPDGSPDESGHCLRLSADGIISELGGKNAAALSAAWRYRGGSFGAETALKMGEPSIVGGAIDPDKSVEIRFILTDLLEGRAERSLILSGRRWAMKLRADGMGVGFGMAPQEGRAIELPSAWRILIGGVPVQSLAYPVGSVLWTMSEQSPETSLGFGKWSRVNSSLPAAWERMG